MTTPESDPYAESGGSDWEVRPAVPGWSAGTGLPTPARIFDDTGWHIDLSNVDWAGNAADRRHADPQGGVDGYGRPIASSRYDRRDRRAGNGAASYPAGPGPQDERTAAWPKRPRRADRPDRQDLPTAQTSQTAGTCRTARLAGTRATPGRVDGAPVTRPGRRPAAVADGGMACGRPARPSPGERNRGYLSPQDYEPPEALHAATYAPAYGPPVYEPPVYEPPVYEPPVYEPPATSHRP